MLEDHEVDAGRSAALVLAVHGSPPRDFPPQELASFFRLHAMAESSAGGLDADLAKQYEALVSKMRGWPRTALNDPFHAGSMEIAKALARAAGLPVYVGFNEFCDPTVDEALLQAARSGVAEVVVVTPMLTRGGEHAERDIPECIARASRLHPQTRFSYAWPFDAETVGDFLAGQIPSRHVSP